MPPFRNSKLWILTLGHFSIDFFASAGSLILAAQRTPLDLTQSQVGLVSLLYSLASSVTQPFFGWLSDRVRGPVLAFVGILWTAVFVTLSGLADTFLLFAVLAPLAGLGVGAFHPPGAAGASQVADAESRGGAMSIFLVGGTGGYAVGPLVAGIVLEQFGSRGTLALGAMGLLVAPVLALTLLRLRYDSPAPTVESAELSRNDSSTAGEIAAKSDVQPVTIVGVALLMAVIFLRSWVSSCLTTYLPQYFTIQGFPLDFAGQVLFAYGLLAPLGSLTGGFLADRVGPRAVIAGSMMIAAPLIVLQLRAEGMVLMVISLLLGFIGTASLPLTVVLGQRLMPARPGVMSGLTMGFTFIMGGIGTYLTGVFADRIGLGTALSWLPLLLATSGVLAVFLPGAGRPPRRSLN